RNMQLVKNAARIERLRAMAEMEEIVMREKAEADQARKEQEAQFSRMIRENAARVKRGAVAQAAALVSVASSSSAQTHHSYVTLYPFCTYVGGLSPPTLKRG